MKRCTSCLQALPHSFYHSNGVGRLRSACKSCESARDKARRPKVPKAPVLSSVQRRDRDRERQRVRRAALAELRPRRPPKKLPRVKVGRFGPEPEMLELDGISRTRREWAKHLGLAGVNSLIGRLTVGGWELRRTLSQHVIFKNQREMQLMPMPRQHDSLSFAGRTQSIEAWAQELGPTLRMTKAALRYRLHHGWPVDRALTTMVRPHRRKRENVEPKLEKPDLVGPRRPVGRPRKQRSE